MKESALCLRLTPLPPPHVALRDPCATIIRASRSHSPDYVQEVPLFEEGAFYELFCGVICRPSVLSFEGRRGEGRGLCLGDPQHVRVHVGS